MAASPDDRGKRLCGAKKRQGEGNCARPAGWGTKHVGEGACKLHGGSTRSVTKGARENMARALVESYGRKIETTPSEAMLDEVKWTAGHVAWLREKVRELEEDDLIWGKTKEKTGGDDWGSTEQAVPNVWLALYQQERTHLVKVCADALRIGIEERRVKLAEQDGALVAQALRGILADLHLTPEQQALVPQVVPRHLRALAG
jgi:hypothetical protein